MWRLSAAAIPGSRRRCIARRRGPRLCALEAVEIGFGGAGRNVGLVNAGMWLAPDDVAMRLGPDYGERLLELLGGGPSEVEALVTKHGIDCEFVRNGTLHCATGPSGLAKIEDRYAQWGRRGAEVKLLSREETARRIGVNIYAGSLLDLRAGTIQPLAYARGLARAALAAGAGVHTRSPVRSAEQTGKVWRLKTDGGTVIADWIVVATDAYAEGAPWPQGKREQIRVPYFNFATRPLSAELRASILPGREGCWDTRMIMNSFRYDQAGRLLFGSIGALRLAGLEVHRAWAKRALKKTFPQIGEVEFEAQWYGMMGMTGNALPRFHRLAPECRDLLRLQWQGHRHRHGVRALARGACSRKVEREGPAAASHRPGRACAAGLERGVLRSWSPNRPCRGRAAVSLFSPHAHGRYQPAPPPYPGPRELPRTTDDCLDFNTLSGYRGGHRCSTDDSTSRLAARRGSLPH